METQMIGETMNTPLQLDLHSDDFFLDGASDYTKLWNVSKEIATRVSKDGLRELILHSDGSLTIKHVNSNSRMVRLDREMYNEMLNENSIIIQEENEETGEARELKLE